MLRLDSGLDTSKEPRAGSDTRGNSVVFRKSPLDLDEVKN